jgi:hypothetical protein
MEAWRQSLLGPEKKRCPTKDKRIDLTPTGLLMEGDYTQDLAIGSTECKWDLTPTDLLTTFQVMGCQLLSLVSMTRDCPSCF